MRDMMKTTLIACALALFTACAAAQDGAFVYRTQNGGKYHRADCRTLQNSKIRITLTQAAEAGLNPCAICKPPAMAPTVAQTIYRVNLAGLTAYKDADISRMLTATVVRHVDGDTVRVRFDKPKGGITEEETIRMIGVDTPETVHPRKGVEAFGKEASEWTKNALLGKKVYIALDWDLRDRYGRLLAYIYTAKGECHNANLIAQGYAHAYTRFPFQFLDEFRALEQHARTAKLGLWQIQ